jgi:hypothetical protein
MRLLSSSSKTGRLIVNGDRGSANLWFEEGRLVAADSSSQPTGAEVVEVVCDILRYGTGSFIFEGDARCPRPGDRVDVEPALEFAEALLVEWHEIAQVVPSMESWLVLSRELPHPEVVVDQACWSSIVAVGSGLSVAEMGRELGLGELQACRLVRALITAGFVEVAARPTPEMLTSLAPQPVMDTDFSDALEHPEDDELGMDPPSLTINGAESYYDQADDRPEVWAEDRLVDRSDETTEQPLEPRSVDEVEPMPADPADVARSLSTLSPKAAQALAAVADSESGEDDQGEAGAIEERSRMLRFLGSV